MKNSNSCDTCGFFADLKRTIVFQSPEGFEYKIYGICFRDIEISYGGYPVYIKEGACNGYSGEEHLNFEPVQMTLQLDKGE